MASGVGSTTPLRIQVLGAYRALLKTRRLFPGDPRMFNAITEKTRASFQQHRNETDATKIQSLIKEAEDAATILTRHVQQVESVGDRYKLVVRPELTTHDKTPTQIEWLSGGGCGGGKKKQQ